MNRPPAQIPWLRLAAAARRAPTPPAAFAPPGFATRVVALAFESRPPASFAAVCDFFSWRALAAAVLIALVSVAANLGAVLGDGEADVFAVSDPVAEVLSLT
jgi:hypothetical protein